MLLVKPVIDKSVQLSLCELCGVLFNDDAYAYFAADTNEDATKINHIIGICQFSMHNGENIITDLSYAPQTEDEEAMIIMARTVMNFMYRCEVAKVYISSNVDEKLIQKLGFKKEDGNFELDLNEFYKSPCRFNNIQA